MTGTDYNNDLSQTTGDVVNGQQNAMPQDKSSTNWPPSDNSGVIYISRIPPKMNPSKLRSLLTAFGKINRIYLMPTKYTKKVGRNLVSKRRIDLFSQGWVEFYDKRDAKAVANQLNATIIGGKKRKNKWHDDMWTIKYLPKFKWRHLQEYMHSNKERDKADIQQRIISLKRENAHYLEQLEAEKRIIKIGEKRRKNNKDFSFGVKPKHKVNPTNTSVSSKLLQVIAS